MSFFTPEQTKESLAAMDRMVRRGQMTEQERAGWVERLDLRPAPQAGVVAETDREIAATILREQGVLDSEAWRRLALSAETEIESLCAQIEQRRASLQNAADERARREFDTSPEGRRLKAAEIADEAARIERDAALAEGILLHERRVPAEMVKTMPAEEKIALAFHSGVDVSPLEASSAALRRSNWVRPSENVDANDHATNLAAAGFDGAE